MIKLEVIENFTLQAFEELKNVERKSGGSKGELKVGDTFECSEEMAKYLMGENKLNKVVAKVIEVKPEKETEPVEETKEEWAVVEEENAVHIMPVENGEVINTPVEKIEKPKKKSTKKKK